MIGELYADVAPPGTASRVDRVRLRRGELTGDWFAWATVSATDIARIAAPPTSLPRAAGSPAADGWPA